MHVETLCQFVSVSVNLCFLLLLLLFFLLLFFWTLYGKNIFQVDCKLIHVLF